MIFPENWFSTLRLGDRQRRCHHHSHLHLCQMSKIARLFHLFTVTITFWPVLKKLFIRNPLWEKSYQKCRSTLHWLDHWKTVSKPVKFINYIDYRNDLKWILIHVITTNVIQRPETHYVMSWLYHEIRFARNFFKPSKKKFLVHSIDCIFSFSF